MKRTSKQGKIRNATRLEVDGVKFRSKLEAFAYRKLQDAGFDVAYEENTYTLMEGFKYKDELIRPITFTPDFVDRQGRFVIECKGWPNDAFPLRWKLFKRYLTINGDPSDLYLPRNQKDVLDTIEILIQKYER